MFILKDLAMSVNINFFLASNPFIDAYVLSDFLGKLIYISLILLSIATWIIIIHHVRLVNTARKQSNKFYESFLIQKSNLLTLDCGTPNNLQLLNPFLELYLVLKKQTIEILNKNRVFGQIDSTSKSNKSPYLTSSDIDVVDSYLNSTISSQISKLERHLYILSTIVTLAPFMGLLGTVWGILTTFSQMQSQSHQMVLGGLSLALATTVIGLIDVIPALIGYNFLKQSIKNYEVEMEQFSTEILASVELQYRKVEAV